MKTPRPHFFPLLTAAFMVVSLVSHGFCQSIGGNSANLSSKNLSGEAQRRFNLALKAIEYNPPVDAIKESNLATHPMFNQVLARIDMRRINEHAVMLLVQMFTAEELAALVKFEQSREGQTIKQKMPGYQKMLGALIQNEFTAAFQGYVAAQSAQAGGASSIPLSQPKFNTPTPSGMMPMGSGLNGTGSPLR